MEVQLLREQEIFPSREVLQDILGKVYDVWAEIETRLRSSEEVAVIVMERRGQLIKLSVLNN